MPVIRTYSGDLPYQAGYKSGKTARQMYEEEKRRQDAKDQATLEFNEKKMNAEKEIEALKIMDTKEKRVQDQLNFEATLAEKKRSTDALNEYRNISNQIKEMQVANKGKNSKLDINSYRNNIVKYNLTDTDVGNDLLLRIKNGDITEEDGANFLNTLYKTDSFNKEKYPKYKQWDY